MRLVTSATTLYFEELANEILSSGQGQLNNTCGSLFTSRAPLTKSSAETSYIAECRRHTNFFLILCTTDCRICYVSPFRGRWTERYFPTSPSQFSTRQNSTRTFSSFISHHHCCCETLIVHKMYRLYSDSLPAAVGRQFYYRLKTLTISCVNLL